METSSSIHTWSHIATPVSEILTFWSLEANRASAIMSSLCVETCGPIHTGVVVTWVDVVLAIRPSVFWGTVTGVGVYTINTSTTIEARTICAVLVIYLAILPAESWLAAACI